MAYLFFPGRHLLTTAFQERYLKEVLSLPVSKMKLLGTPHMGGDEKINEIVFAVTSANQSNSRYNPIPFWARLIALDRFAHAYKDASDVRYRMIGIPHYPPTHRYIELLLKEIYEATSDQLRLVPENTLVLCSTPPLIELFMQRGFAVLPAEYDYAEKQFVAKPPAQIIRDTFEGGQNWKENDEFRKNVSGSSQEVWENFPDIPATVERIWRDPLLNESGSLTQERNYFTYAVGMGHKNLIDLKYQDIKEMVVQGKIADEGCADGALIAYLAKDFPDSDIIGIEITSEFMARCLERQRSGEFGDTFVHFHQRNLLDPIFKDNSIDTTICNSTTHEIWSYGKREESLRGYIEKKYKQMRSGGHLVIRDVVGPENKGQEVYMQINTSDGTNTGIFTEFSTASALAKHLAGLSTYARFLRFAEDYLKDMRSSGKRGEETKVRFREEIIDGKKFVVVRLKDAVEFMTKKDYFDNWRSELNEEFAFYNFSDWKRLLEECGFFIIENPNDISRSSRVYANPWIVENRFRGKTDLFLKQNDSSLEPLEYPVTNMVLIGEKRERINQ